MKLKLDFDEKEKEIQDKFETNRFINQVKLSENKTRVLSLSQMSYAYIEWSADPGFTSTYEFEMIKSVDFDIWIGVASLKTSESFHD